MIVVKVCSVGILTAAAMLVLKESKSGLSYLICVVGGMIILFSVVDYYSDILTTLSTMLSASGINNDLFKCVFKIVTVGYITEFSVGIIEDMESRSVANKVMLAGRVLIVALSMPIIESLIKVITELL